MSLQSKIAGRCTRFLLDGESNHSHWIGRGGLMFVHYRFWLFASAAVLFGATCLSTVWFIGETHHPLPDQASPSFSGFVTNYRSVLKDRTFLRYLLQHHYDGYRDRVANRYWCALGRPLYQTTVSIGSWAIVHLGGLAMLGFYGLKHGAGSSPSTVCWTV